MHDKILEAFLEQQSAEGKALDAASDILKLMVIGADSPPTHYLMEFHCKGLASVNGEIVEANRFAVSVFFPPEYLRRPVDPLHVLTCVHPQNAWHPNQYGPMICIGDIAPGTGLVDLAHQVYEVVSYQKLTPVETDALNPAACAWARRNMHRFPLDPRPLRRPPTQSFAGPVDEEQPSC